jgi:single-stranded-DNA-specific exonuclease
MTVLSSERLSQKNKSVLGVARSCTEHRWVMRGDCDERDIETLCQRFEVSSLLATLCLARDIGIDEAETVFAPSIKSLMPDPYTLTDMEKAVKRIAKAVANGEKTALFGDYDVDGATSTSIMVRFLRAYGINPLFHIPDRLTEGYGPNNEAIQRLAGQGVSLLITLDCGSTSFEPLQEAKKLGLETVVIDHHQVGETLPEAAAVINPNRHDDLSGLGHLAAVGVTFLTLVALKRYLTQTGINPLQPLDLLSFLDLVALGTVADVVPLKGLNRAFVKKGLVAIRHRGNVGLSALCDAARLSGTPAPFHLGFLLGPRINAGGRIGNAALGTKLLICDDPIEARAIASQLDNLNQERQSIEQETLAQAEASLTVEGFDEDSPLTFVWGEDWHPGVVGLIAARLKERYNRPAFALASTKDGLVTGSARSIPGVDIGAAVHALVKQGIAEKGGGHAMAAGLTLIRSNINLAKAFLKKMLMENVNATLEESKRQIDGILTASGATTELVRKIESMGPFGSGFSEPVFAFPSHRILDASIVGKGHIRATLASGNGDRIKAIAFRAEGQPLGNMLMKARGAMPVHIAGILSLDNWGGRDTVQLRILDAAQVRHHAT